MMMILVAGDWLSVNFASDVSSSSILLVSSFYTLQRVYVHVKICSVPAHVLSHYSMSTVHYTVFTAHFSLLCTIHHLHTLH